MKKFIRKNSRYLYPLAIPVIVFLLFLPFIMQGRTFIGRDMAVLGIPILSFVHMMGKAGKIYLWNPYISMGLPIWASSLGTCFYVFNAFFLVFDPIKTVFYYFLLHKVMAGLCAFYYLRNNRFSNPASLAGALLYAFSATRIYYLHNIERYPILTFAPLILLLIDRLVERSSVKSAILMGVVSGILVTSGGLQLMTIYGMVFVCYGLLRAYRAKKLFKLKTFGLLTLVAFIAGGISSIFLLPMMELNTQNPFRSVPLIYEHASSGSVAPWNVLLVPFANFLGDAETVLRRTGVSPWEHSYYLGFAGIFLAFMAFLFLRKKRKMNLFFFLGMMLIGAFFALGRNNPIYPFLHEHFYFFNHFRGPSRFLAVTPLFMMFVSAAGIENLELFIFKGSLVPDGLRKRAGYLFTGLTIFGIIYFLFYLALGYRSFFTGVMLAVSLLLPVAVMGMIAFNKHLSPGIIKVSVLLIIISVLLTLADPLIFIEKSYFSTGDFFNRELAFLGSIKNQIPVPYPRILYANNPNSASVVGLCNTCGYFPLDMENYTEYIYATFAGRMMEKPAFTRLVHFTFHPAVLLLEAAGKETADGTNPLSTRINWKEVYFRRLEGNPMYRMLCPAFTILPDSYFPEKDYLGRFWFSRGYRVITGKEEILKTLMNREFDPFDYVIINENPPPEYGETGKNREGEKKAVISSFEPDEIHVELNGQHGWLTMSDRYYPGWTAEVDGGSRKIFRGNYLFRTIFIKHGEKKLVLRYKPRGFEKGFVISMTTLIVSGLLYLIMCLIKRKK